MSLPRAGLAGYSLGLGQSLKEVRVPIPGKLAFLSGGTGAISPKAACAGSMMPWRYPVLPCATLLDQLPADFAPLYDGFLLTLSYFSPTNCLQNSTLLNKLAWRKT